ncbi:MAG: DUF3488 domain-containing transglutaminase family protein [Bdellovibrionales bacterium]|nr:DUF3488 domain-containing transglutaminase family protein [Oligoflexia bacterium]
MSSFRRDQTFRIYLLALVILHLCILIPSVPYWTLALSVFIVLWKGIHWTKGVRGPRKKEIWILGALGMFAIFQAKHTFLGEEAGAMVLVLMAGCKLGESENYRDYGITLILCFLLLSVYLLGSQGVLSLAFLLLDTVLLVQFLFILHPSGVSAFSLRAVLKLLACLLPVWALFFFVFPRFAVGFWHHENPRITTGFTEQLRPGSVGQVAESDEIAFRIHFESPLSSPEKFYWRGSVLALTDGLNWNRSNPSMALENQVSKSAIKMPYQIWLEPQFQRWLFTLDYPDIDSAPKVSGNSVRQRAGSYYELARPPVGRFSYRTTYSEESPLQSLSNSESKAYLQLPSSLEQEVKDLASELNVEPGNAQAAIAKMEQWFRKQDFHYSLNPGKLRVKQLSEFLFGTKLGFCEHYAAAGAVLLRAMGYPARVVIGFQGADRNAMGDYWMVRNRNAHAWDEVFVMTDYTRQRGYWRRVDLVAVVTPVRMALGAAFFSSEASKLGDSKGLSLETYRSHLGLLAKSALKVELFLDAAEMKWVRFLTEYDFEFQQNLLRKIGFRDASARVFLGLLFSCIALWMLVFTLIQGKKAKRGSPLLKMWQEFAELFISHGIMRAVHEGPREFSGRLKVKFPEHAEEIENIAASFISLRYEEPDSNFSNDQQQALKNKINDLKRSLRRVRC